MQAVTEPEQKPVNQRMAWGWILTLLALLVLSYGNTLWHMSSSWFNDPMYSHGWTIPLFAGLMIYFRRQPLTLASSRDRWLGVGLIALFTAIRVFGSYRVNFTLDNISIIPCVLGIFLMVGGRECLRWAAGPILFMVFMIPLPGFVVDRVLKPMQTVATMSSNYALQTLGADSYRDGNRIILEFRALGVVDQCSGLRMLTVFMGLSVALAMLSEHRPLWERAALVVSSIPIALLVNSIRITITGYLYNLNFGSEIVDHVFHDLAGWIMMPIAFGFLWLVSKILANLVIEDTRPDGVTPSVSLSS